MTGQSKALLLAANWDSGVGYAWWLMESYWVVLARRYAPEFSVYLAYPSISTLPATVTQAPITTCIQDFSSRSFLALITQSKFLFSHSIRTMYLSDSSSVDWRYAIFRLVGVRAIITHDHTPGIRTRPRGIKRLLKSLIHRLPLVTADAVIAATSFVHARHIEVNCSPRNRCFTVPNGLPTREPAEALDINTLFAIPDCRRIMVTASRAHTYKGIDFALRLIARLVRTCGMQDLHYIFCGDGPQLAALQVLANELSISDHVSFAGRRNDVRGILAASHIAIHPSKGEVGYSLSILEYMEAGLPTLVPDNPSVCGATQHGRSGFLYRENDLDDAAKFAVRLLNDPEFAASLGDQARRVLISDFCLERSHRALVDVFATCDANCPAEPTAFSG